MFPELTLLIPGVLVALALLAISLPILGAVTSATVLDNTITNGLMKVVDITAADDDTEITVTHSLGLKNPIKIDFERVLAVARASEWLADSTTSTNVHFSKLSVASSSSTGRQVRAYIWVPHHVIR
jgi:tetrahydromethanopterin S-methyltransferase subunit C